MLRWLSCYMLRLFGWHTSSILPGGIEKAVLIVAPHTSYWDFVIGRLTFWAGGLKIRVLIKSEVFFFPLGFFLKKMGAVPVARGKKNNMIDQALKLFRENKSLVIVITPEGTRRRVKQWKKGFYLIAKAAGLPIALAYIDYEKKIGGIGPLVYPSGDYEKDMHLIQEFYRGITPKYPEKFYLPQPVINK